MAIYCTETFRAQFAKLIKKTSYADLEEELINHFFNKDIAQLSTGTRLNNSDTTPYIKKRLAGSGGYRMYYLLLIKDGNVYLMFVHPKSGSMGYDNITDASKAALYKEVLKCIQHNELYFLRVVGDKVHFDPVK
ncbi:MAG: hypothetical protein C0424_05510 [Sphingobacteriaceae bacterium]|nr:hypothetical protein [Sphingobacteriaceae bacterium]